MYRFVINFYSYTTTETAPEDGLDPTGEAIGVVAGNCQKRRRLSTLDACNSGRRGRPHALMPAPMRG